MPQLHETLIKHQPLAVKLVRLHKWRIKCGTEDTENAVHSRLSGMVGNTFPQITETTDNAQKRNKTHNCKKQV
jgi:hypothetical protein